MPGEEVATGPAGAIIAFGRYVLGKKKDRVTESSSVSKLKRRGDWENPDAILAEMSRLESIPTKQGSVQNFAKGYQLRELNQRLLDLEERGILPESDFAGGETGESFPGELSPVFGAPAALGGAAGMVGDARDRVMRQVKRAMEDAKLLEKGRKKKPDVFAKAAKQIQQSAIGQKSKDVITAAIKTAKVAVPKVSKLAKKGGGRVLKVAKVGGPVVTLGTIGLQVGIEKISQILEKRQFGEQERILRRQQAETNKVVRQIRKEKAGTAAIKAAQPPSPPPRTKTGQGVAKEPARPKPAAASKPAAVAAQKAVKAAEPAKQAPKPPKPLKAGSIIYPTSTVGVRSEIRKALEFGQKAAPLYNLLKAKLNQPTINRSSFAPAVPRAERQPSPIRSSFFGPAPRAAVQSCECKPSRAKQAKKKRAKRRVCVSPSTAKAAGLAV